MDMIEIRLMAISVVHARLCFFKLLPQAGPLATARCFGALRTRAEEGCAQAVASWLPNRTDGVAKAAIKEERRTDER